MDNRNLMRKLKHTRKVMNIDFIVILMDYIVIYKNIGMDSINGK